MGSPGQFLVPKCHVVHGTWKKERYKMNRIIKAWRVLRGIPTYNDDEKFMETKRDMESVTRELRTAMELVREIVPHLHTHQEFLRLNLDQRRMAVFIRNNYAQEIQNGEHQIFRTVADVALHYMTYELEAKGRKVRPAPTEVELSRTTDRMPEPPPGKGNPWQ